MSAVIVGGGLMGCDISAIFVNAGWPVQLVEQDEARHAPATARVQTAVGQMRGPWNAALLSTRAGLAAVDWADVQIVVETVTEKLAVKRAVFAELDRVVPPHIPIGSNSSGMRITDIAEGCASAGRMANAHFFLPAHLVPLVELAQGERTAPETLDELKRIFTAVGRIAVKIAKDLPGFLANRIQHAMMREAFSLIDQGLATPEDVDAAVRYGFGFRYAAVGPIVQKEIAGLETQREAAAAIYPSLCNDATPAKVLEKLVAEGRYGTKTGSGFWDWTPEQAAAERARYEDALRVAADLIAGSPSKLPGPSRT